MLFAFTFLAIVIVRKQRIPARGLKQPHFILTATTLPTVRKQRIPARGLKLNVLCIYVYLR